MDDQVRRALRLGEGLSSTNVFTNEEYYQPEAPFGENREGSSLEWKNNVFFVAFSTKWMDGNRFTLNFTGAGSGRDNDSFNTVRGTFRRLGSPD